ncbi:MAG: M48 family metalloprotease [Bacteroidales bacterium]
MKTAIRLLVALALPAILFFSACKDDNGVNLFTVEDDKAFGLQMKEMIQSDPAKYPVLNKNQHPEAYSHIERVRDSILATGLVNYDKEFVWEVFIINDTIMNAFCTPGGYVYFFTDLIKFLDNEAEFAGVMAHEMSHAARRHSTQQLTKAYGLQILLSIVLGQNPNQLAEIAADLAAGVAFLAFSRSDEYQADEDAVKYLYATSYDARGVAGFFEKIEGNPQPPEFLSTHPNPGNRIEKILEIWQSLGGKEGETFPDRYQQFKNSLP